MKTLTVVAAGLGYNLLERNGMLEMAGLRAGSAPSVFPAVTCVAQASLRTGLSPADHGMVSNGWWSHDLRKPLFWEQSARIVKGARVWDELRRIPYGATISYGELARRIGNPAATRAVAGANARNPVSILVPCHRVIAADGGLGGYGGGLSAKRLLLDLERDPARLP